MNERNAFAIGAMFGFLVGIWLMSVLSAVGAKAQTPYLVAPDGQYLGDLSANPYAPNSTSNPYGRFGSEFSPDSINNPYGRFGSPYSNESATNPYATNPPRIIAPRSCCR